MLVKDTDNRKWEVLEREYLFRRPWLTARKDVVKLPNGNIIPEFYVLEYPDWVNVIAITTDEKFVMIRQYRHGLGETRYELCAGVVDPGEDPLTAAKRELYEETGYRGRVIGCSRPGWSSPGLTGETICMVKIEIDGDAYRGQTVESHPEECEHIEVFRVRRTELAAFVAAQEAQGVGIDTKIYTYLAAME